MKEKKVRQEVLLSRLESPASLWQSIWWLRGGETNDE
jgi:hypothetical protein